MTLDTLFDRFEALGWLVSLNEQRHNGTRRYVLTLIHADVQGPISFEADTPESTVSGLLAYIERSNAAFMALVDTLK